MQNMAKRSKVK